MSMSTSWIESMTNSTLLCAVKNHLENIIIRFTEEASGGSESERTRLFQVWNQIVPEYNININTAIEREINEKNSELRKQQQKKEECKSGPTCQYFYSSKSKTPNQLCGEHCKNLNPSSDGNIYCARHRKQIESKHTCSFILGSKSKNPGECCGSRVSKNDVYFDRIGEYEGKIYKGTWLCKKHKDQVNKGLDKNENRCVHISGEKSKNPGKRCKSITKDGEFCSKHSNKTKKIEKNKNDKRKDLKTGKSSKSVSLKFESENEQELDDPSESDKEDEVE